MSGIAIAFLAYLAFGSVTVVASVGKQRKPITPGIAAAIVSIDIIVAAVIIWTSR